MFPNAIMLRPGLNLALHWGSVIKESLESIEYIPRIGRFFRNLCYEILILVKPTTTIVIDEFDAVGSINDLYDSAQLYLGTYCLSGASAVRLVKPSNTDSSTALLASLPEYHSVLDTKNGITLKWTSLWVQSSVLRSSRNPWGDSQQQRSLKIIFNRKHHQWVSDIYIKHVTMEADKLRSDSRERRLYTNRAIYKGDDLGRLWTIHSFSHPSTFDTLALEPNLRDEIWTDLHQFVDRQSHYQRVGRAWKRGYLLYGPPGTGKTSLIAAIANELNFDVYDLELTTVPTNSHLRKLLVSTTPKSIVLIEDIDRTLDLLERKRKREEENTKTVCEVISLSGLLNVVDGLWSSCAGERLIIFTSNNPERLDEALLRPGRMDKKIKLGYCGPGAFRVLVKNYFYEREEEREGNETMVEIERLLQVVEMTAAEVAAVFTGASTVDEALNNLLAKLRRREAGESTSYNSLLNINSEDDAGMEQATSATRWSKRGKRKTDGAAMVQATSATKRSKRGKRKQMVQELCNAVQPRAQSTVNASEFGTMASSSTRSISFATFLILSTVS